MVSGSGRGWIKKGLEVISALGWAVQAWDSGVREVGIWQFRTWARTRTRVGPTGGIRARVLQLGSHRGVRPQGSGFGRPSPRIQSQVQKFLLSRVIGWYSLPRPSQGPESLGAIAMICIDFTDSKQGWGRCQEDLLPWEEMNSHGTSGSLSPWYVRALLKAWGWDQNCPDALLTEGPYESSNC